MLPGIGDLAMAQMDREEAAASKRLREMSKGECRDEGICPTCVGSDLDNCDDCEGSGNYHTCSVCGDDKTPWGEPGPGACCRG